MRCSCGKVNDDGATFCAYCGSKLISVAPSPGSAYGQAYGNMTSPTSVYGQPYGEMPSPTPVYGQPYGEMPSPTPVYGQPYGEMPSPSPAPVYGSASGEIPKPTPVKRPEYIRPATSDSMLWSWLYKKGSRSRYDAEGKPRISEPQFAAMVSSKLSKDGIPAIVEKANITWDIGGPKSDIYKITPSNLRSGSVNPLTYIFQLNYVGKHAFVDAKTFITPPNLPDAPGTENPEKKGQMNMLILGIALFFAGMSLSNGYYSSSLGGVLVFCGIAIACIAGFATYTAYEIRQQNEEIRRKKLAWQYAWEVWENQTLLYSFQEVSNGEIGRLYEAVQEEINELCKALFECADTEAETENISMNQLEEMIARRKNEYR